MLKKWKCAETIFFDISGYLEIPVFKIRRVSYTSSIFCLTVQSYNLHMFLLYFFLFVNSKIFANVWAM